MSVALLQYESIVGDCTGNAQRLLDWIAHLGSTLSGVELLVTPELSLCGYCPEDWLLHPTRWTACSRILAGMAASLAPDVFLLMGYPEYVDHRMYNAVALLSAAEGVRTVYRKQVLPNTGVFDEQRYFTPGYAPAVICLPSGLRIALAVCEDIWSEDWRLAMRGILCDQLVVMNASPYERDKYAKRHQVVADCARTLGVSVAYCNMLGGQDEWVFDGRSFFMSASGECLASAPAYQPYCLLMTERVRYSPLAQAGTISDLYDVLCYALATFMRGIGATDIVLGLSGGIDSALVLTIAQDVLGADHCHALMLYTPYTSAASREDAAALSAALEVDYQEQDIWPLCSLFAQQCQTLFTAPLHQLTQENLQARVRMLFLMAYANQHPQTVLLGTSNKSELMMGYATLYGDLAGAFILLKDVLKTDVYALAAYRNQRSPVIPERILTRAPSAELAPGQKDSDSLPEYAVIDAWIQCFTESREGGVPLENAFLMQRVKQSEFKRYQAPLGPKVTGCALGKDWRYPLNYHESVEPF